MELQLRQLLTIQRVRFHSAGGSLRLRILLTNALCDVVQLTGDPKDTVHYCNNRKIIAKIFNDVKSFPQNTVYYNTFLFRVSGDWLVFGTRLKCLLEELQFLVLGCKK